MATEQVIPDDESKKDTVRINLPPGLSGAPAPGGPTTVKLKPATQDLSAEEEAKKETAVMGRPAAAPKAKSDTSRVQVTGAKPGTPEMPRPTVKLKQAEPAPVAPGAVPPAPASVAAAPVVQVAGGPGAVDVVFAVLAVVASLAVTGYIYNIAK